MPINLILSLLQSYWKPLVIGFALLTYSYFWYHQGQANVRAEWNEAIIEATKQARIVESNNALLGAKIGGRYVESTKTIDTSFNDALASLRGQPGGNLPSKGNTTGGVDAKTTCGRFSNPDKETFVELMRAAQKQTNQLVLLQDWVDGSQ